MIAMLFLVACANIPHVDPVEYIECQTDTDCVPALECHPKTCIPEDSTTGKFGPEICTQQFECEAAYTTEDCGCVNNKCINKNVGRDCSQL